MARIGNGLYAKTGKAAKPATFALPSASEIARNEWLDREMLRLSQERTAARKAKEAQQTKEAA